MRSPGIVRMRQADEHERAATPLELLFDLSFVVAVAFLAAELHHGIADDHALDAARTYVLLFVPLWWTWMSFTWFSTAFDVDDPIHRVLSMAQMIGALAVAGSIHDAAKGDLKPFVVGLAIARIPLIVLWLRAGQHDEAHRRFARTYAGGLVVAMLIWLLGGWSDGVLQGALLVGAVLVDLATPVAAVRAAPGPVFHAGHIAERYGLFALIVIGESILAVATAFEVGFDGDLPQGEGLLALGAAALIVFSMWWLYFDALGRTGLTRRRSAAFIWGYGHYLIYAAIAAIGAGFQVRIESLAGEEVPEAALAIAFPVGIAVLAMAWLQRAANAEAGSAVLLAASGAAVLVAGLLGSLLGIEPVVIDVLAGLVVAATVAVMVRRAPEADPAVLDEVGT